MKKIIIVLTLLYSSLLFSQIKIVGKVVNQKNQGVEFVEIILLSKDSIAIKSELTNSNGAFFMNTEKGDYMLQLRQMGVVLYKQKINVVHNLDLGVLKIVENNVQLSEVVINTKKKLIERKVDRLVYNVENSISASGGDAIDALKTTPGIKVQNDAITMIGKSGMAVMIDDKIIHLNGEELVFFLKTIQNNNIKSIEVITNPPARYSAEGNSGLVNIILKKSMKDSWSGALNTAYKQTTYPAGTIGGSLNYQVNKISVAFNSSYNKGFNQGIESSEIFYPKEKWTNINTGKYYTNSINNRLGFNYTISKKWDMGLQYIGSVSSPDIDDNNLAVIIDNQTNIRTGIIKTNGKNARKKEFNSLNYYTAIKLDTLGKKLSFDLDYFDYKLNSNRNFYTNSAFSNPNSTSYNSVNNITNQQVRNYASQINVDFPLKWAVLNFGSKLSFSRTISDVNYFDTTSGTAIPDASQSNMFEYKENIQALYFSGNKKLFKDKVELNIGLRMESTQKESNSITNNSSVKNDYLNFFPTTYLSYTPSENRNVSINYGKRIYRPGFYELNPFRWYSSPYTYSEGNPNLQPTFSHNVEMSHTYKDYLISTLSYSKDIDNSGQVVFLSGVDYNQKITRLNYYNSSSLAFQQTYLFKKIEWLENQNSAYVYYQHSDSKIYPITPKESSGFGAGIATSNTFTIYKGILLCGFDLNYSFPVRSSDLVYNTDSTLLNIFMRINLLNKKLQISIAGNNILKAYDFNNKSTRNGIEAIYKGYYDSRYLRIGMTYKFGNSKINIAKRQNSNDDEKARVNKN